jgi:hypothetical protein
LEEEEITRLAEDAAPIHGIATSANDFEDVNDLLEPLVVAELEAREAICTMLDDYKVHVKEGIMLDKIVSFVEYEGIVIYKSTLVSQLNSIPFHSKDRLTKIRNSIYFNNSKDYLNAANATDTCLLGLGSNCAVYMVQCSTTKKSSTSKVVRKRTRNLKNKAIKESNIYDGVDESFW